MAPRFGAKASLPGFDREASFGDEGGGVSAGVSVVAPACSAWVWASTRPRSRFASLSVSVLAWLLTSMPSWRQYSNNTLLETPTSLERA